MGAEEAGLREQLSQAVAHRCALQEALAAVEAERNALRWEEGKLRGEYARTHEALVRLHARTADLHGALNVARAEKERLEAALAGALPTGTAEPAPPRPAAAEPEPPAQPKLRPLPTPPVIEVRDLCKSYRVPARPVDTLKERLVHPIRSSRSMPLEALRNVSFDIHQGEFFGIVGANGSGKSTLLKLLANVYAPDSGTIRTAGRIVPFIELGVGLNPEFAAYDNVVISGVMMGLEPEEARARYPEIIEFAGLQDFTELKLKNYSSGMRVRLAFAVMAQVDADILLIDEVLAVGDAEFREKCLARTNQLRDEGKTIVLVTHSMGTMVEECDRSILLGGGEIRAIGDPREVARRYERELAAGEGDAEEERDEKPAIRLVKG
ncbi:MAG TPA: ABC transporter ATP-binding protein [Solirubrobacterales bacterium]|nr:ABC transporter ATP-binding protein [Solirubrobacterales bacterium]